MHRYLVLVQYSATGKTEELTVHAATPAAAKDRAAAGLLNGAGVVACRRARA